MLSIFLGLVFTQPLVKPRPTISFYHQDRPCNLSAPSQILCPSLLWSPQTPKAEMPAQLLSSFPKR